MLGGGGGGAGLYDPGNHPRLGCASGGASGWCVGVPIHVTPGGTLDITVGLRGTQGPPSAGSGVGAGGGDGGNSEVSGIRCSGGLGGGAELAQSGGRGGNLNHADGGSMNDDGKLAPRQDAQPGLPLKLAQSGVRFWGGGGGGGLCGASRPDGALGCPAVNNVPGGQNGAIGGADWDGSGGASTPYGQGGIGLGGDAGSTHYGAGGGGSGLNGRPDGYGGYGAGGYVLLTWIEP